MTAVVESPAPAQVMRSSAATLADEKLSAAVESFLCAAAAAAEALSNLTPAQASGPDGWPPHTEYLVDEAQHRWDVLARGWAEGLLPPEAREAGAEYARPKVVCVPVAQSGPWDWSKGRGA